MENILEIKNLTVDYGAIRALKGVNLNIPKGKIVVVLGANGAGKTTMLRTLSGIVRASGGEILYKGKDIKNKEPYKIARQGIGQSPEGRYVLAGLTTEENLKVGASSVKSAAQIRKNFDEVYTLFPLLAERKHQQSTTLSGGEQQMLAIGRALMMKPELLLLDEPSLGLAPLIIKSIFEAIKKISAAGVTIMMVEQNARQSLLIADYAYVLELGLVKTQGSASELLADDNLISAYLGKNKKEK